jgi:DNA-binding transcriptional MerR regulator
MEKSSDAFRTISEVSDILGTPAHVLRFWESRFPQIRPVKRAGGRRYYRPSDVALLGGIKRLLHDEGLTIRGVQKVLREHGIRHVAGLTLVPGAMAVQPLPEVEEALPVAVRPPAERKVAAPRKLVAALPEPPAGEQAAPLPLWAAAVERSGQRAETPPQPVAPSRPPVAGDDTTVAEGGVMAESGVVAESGVWLPPLLRMLTAAQVQDRRDRLIDIQSRLLALRNRVADAARRPVP